MLRHLAEKAAEAWSPAKRGTTAKKELLVSGFQQKVPSNQLVASLRPADEI